MKISKLILVAAIFAFGSVSLSHAQQQKAKAAPRPSQPVAEAPVAAAPAADAAGAPPVAGWAVRCSSVSRGSPPECAMEQTAVLSKTGQLVVLISIRVPSDTRMPVAFVQLPLGLNLPGGARLQIDDGKPTDLQIQTCEQRGCFANAQITPELLAALKAGKQLKVSFQNLSKETISIPMQLTDFASAYEKIK